MYALGENSRSREIKNSTFARVSPERETLFDINGKYTHRERVVSKATFGWLNATDRNFLCLFTL